MITRMSRLSAHLMLVLICGNALSITKTGEIAVPEEPNNLFVSGDYLYVANTDSGLMIYDVSDGASPSRAGSYDSSGRQEGFDDVAVSGDYAYCCREAGGIRILDVSNPAAPALVDLVDEGGGTCIAETGGNAFVGNGDGIDVYAVGTIGASERLTRYYLNPDSSDYEYAEDIQIQGSYAYVAYEDSGLHLFDISSPASPVSVGRYSEADGMRLSGVAVSGDHAYLSTPDEGVKIIDISDPSNPRLAGDYNRSMGGGDAWGVEAVGTMVYLLYQEWGVYTIDASDPANPSYAAKYPSGMAFNGDYRYMAVSGAMIYLYYDESTTIYVLDASDVAVDNPLILSRSPEATLTFRYLSGPEPAFVLSNFNGKAPRCRCALFAPDGRVVSRGTAVPAGGNAVVWKPGKALAKGTYVLTVWHGGNELSREIRVH